MKRDLEGARARVEGVLRAGRRVADALDSLGRAARSRLVETSGLSPEGVSLALSSYLETQPSEEELLALLGQTGDAPRTHVVLSANVCTAPLRALALAVATSKRVLARPSRREPVLAELLAEALSSDRAFLAAGGSVELVSEVCPEPADEAHLYGADASIAAIEARFPRGVVVRGHGTGVGLAIVSASASLEDAALRIAEDTVVFDQRGCLSPRFVLVEGDPARALGLSVALDAALAQAALRVPRGALDAGTLSEIAMYGASMQALGTFLERPSHAIGVDEDPCPRALVLAPPARVLHVASARLADACRLVAYWDRFVTVLGMSDASSFCETIAARLPHARHVPLGAMQRPPLDGPVDLRLTSAPRVVLAGSYTARSS